MSLFLTICISNVFIWVFFILVEVTYILSVPVTTEDDALSTKSQRNKTDIFFI